MRPMHFSFVPSLNILKCDLSLNSQNTKLVCYQRNTLASREVHSGRKEWINWITLTSIKVGVLEKSWAAAKRKMLAVTLPCHSS